MQTETKRDESGNEENNYLDGNEEKDAADEGQKVTLDMIKGWRTGLEVLLLNVSVVNHVHLAAVVQRGDNVIQRINRYPADKCYKNVLRYPPDRDLSSV